MCNHCTKKLSIGISAMTGKDKGTKSLADHLRSKHSIVAESIEQDTKERSAKRTKQQKVKDMLLAANQLPLNRNSDKAVCIQRAILEMIAVHNRPFTIVEDCMMPFVFHTLCSAFVCPGIIFFRTTQLEESEYWATLTVKDEIAKQPYLHCTSNIWTCKYTGTSMLSITIHWFCIRMGKFRKVVMCTILSKIGMLMTMHSRISF